MKLIQSLLALALALFGCGGIDDTTNEDFRVIITRVNTMPDGTEETIRTVGEIDTSWQDQDTDIDGPWFHQNEVSAHGDVQKFAYGANSRYGLYSGVQGQGEGRCPNTWSSPQYCVVPGTKSFKYLYYPPVDDASDGIVDAALYTEWVQAQGVSSYGGFSHCTGLVCSGAPGSFNAWFDNSDGTCGGTALACQEQAEGATFTSGGKRFRKTIPYNAFGWNAGFLVYSAVNIEPTNFNNYIDPRTPVAAFRANATQNHLEHELAHINGNHHNPSGGTTRATLASPDMFYDPGTAMTSAEISAASAYAP